MVGSSRGTVLVTGVGRRQSIAAALAVGLAEDGWDLALNYWSPYDDRVWIHHGSGDPEEIAEECRDRGGAVDLLPGDLSDPAVPGALVTAAATRGHLAGLVMSHCESVPSSILTTSVESWDRHFAVNARATWLLIKEFASRLPVGDFGGEPQAKIIALTSDHTVHNTPYGASKGALDRLVIAATAELADRGVRANVINPGPVDTGWMNDEIRASAIAETPAGRIGTPAETARLVRFLMSDEGSWINGQLLYSNGGFGIG